MRKNRSPLFSCLLMLILCASIVVGSTYAQFTDNVVVNGNIISSGRLKAGLSWTESLTPDAEGKVEWQDAKDATIFNYPYWEPGFTDVKFIRIDNTGSLAFQYKLGVVPAQPLTGTANLMDVIDVYYAEVEAGTVVTREDYASKLTRVGTLSEIAAVDMAALQGILLPEKTSAKVTLPESAKDIANTGSVTGCIVLHMQETAGNEYQNLSAGEGFNLQLYATQYTWEEDSFDNSYDEGAKLPVLTAPTNVTMPVQVDTNGLVQQAVNFTSPTGVTATVPAGAKVEPGVTELTLVVEFMSRSAADVNLKDSEELASYNVKVVGLAADNTVPVLINLGKVLPEGLNMGNYQLYHVENGTTAAMTLVAALGDPATHNTFTYDPVEGNVSVAMATFSEVAVVADTENAWNGEFDYDWYSADAKELTIANADQLAAFGAIVGGMAKDENGDKIAVDSFAGKTVKLIADVNLGDKESENDPDLIFYPIGYYNSEGTYERTNTAITSGLRNFEGTFDGNGHTIANFYQNTWEMKGDHNWYSPEEQYYRDGMGLFGKVYGGTVKNLTVSNFSSDGEIATTGVIAAYADGATFENIAITNCNPRVYNIGNGGIVGCVGWYAEEAGLKTTFTNITVDNSNKISALWGSYDVACGGLVGQYYPTSGQTSANSPKNAGIEFKNCHVSAIMDVYNDVCGNYQYYAYRYAGMIIGSIRENTTKTIDGVTKTIPDMTGISATGCTVNYGDWNDYYYCEFEKNGHPSYSGPDDYKFSRVPHSELRFTDSNGNGLVDANERASVTGCKHDHTPAENNKAIYLPFHQLFTGYGWGVSSIGLEKYSGIVTNLDITEGDQQESVEKFEGKVTKLANNKKYKLGDIFTFVDNGVELVPEALTVYVDNLDEGNPVSAEVVYDKNNWENGTLTLTGTGKVQIGIQDYYFCTPTVIEVNVTDREAEEKFKANENLTFTHTTEGGTIEKMLGDIFTAVDGAEINSANVVVTIEDDGCTYSKDENDWTKSKLSFTGKGEVTITITDNDYCLKTTATMTITEPDPVAKFALVFPNTAKYLYRVGNQNTVALGSLFKVIDDNVTIGNVSVSIDNVAGDAAGTYTSNAPWTKGTIQFSGTGVVKVTITDNDYCIPTELYLEVVDATNVTAYSELKDRNSVLLDNITMPNGVYWLNNHTLYGNGFTFNVVSGTDSNTENGYVSTNGTVVINNAMLDNVVIIGEVYTQYGGKATSEYNFPTVLANGNSVIANSYISHGSSPVRAGSGCNLEIINSTLDGGIFANLDIRGGKITLKDVTTINQTDAAGNAINNDKGIVGLGIVIYTGSTVTIDIENLTQYNCVSENAEFTGDAKTLKDVIFGGDYIQYQFEYEDVTWAHTGIVSMVPEVKGDNIDDIAGYAGQDAEILGFDGYVYARTEPDTVDTPKSYKPSAQYHVAPTYTFDYTTKNNVPQVSGSNDYCVFDGATGHYLLSFDDGETGTWETDILTVTKGGETLNYNVSVSGGATIANGEITFDTAGDYTVTYTYTDEVNYRLTDGSIETYSVTYEKNVYITVYEVVDTSAKTEFAFGSNGFRTETANDLTYVMPNVNATVDSNTAGIGVTTIGGKNIYYPIVSMHKSGSNSWYNYFSVFEAITITDLDGNVYSTSTTEMPSGLAVIGGFILDANGNVSTAESANGTGIFNYATGKEIKCAKYSSYGLCYYPDSQFSKTGTTSRAEQTIVAKYRYTDSNGTPYYYYVGYWCEAHTKTEICVTPDTLVTLADGTKKEIQYVTYEDQLLVWDFYKGEYAVAPAAIISNHGYGENIVIALTFSDGTVVKAVNGHAFVDMTVNDMVFIDADNAESYVGHSFAKANADGYEAVTLTSYTVSSEMVEAWGVLTAGHFNCITEDMISFAGSEKELASVDYFEYGDGLKYDEATMQADIETYGVYTYEEFAQYLSEAQFEALGIKYMTITVGKGKITHDYILELINTYVK